MELTNYELLESRLHMFGDLSPEGYYHNMPGYTAALIESVTVSGEEPNTELPKVLEEMNQGELVSGRGLLEGICAVVSDTCDKKAIIEFFNRYRATAKYEFTHENYSDIPLIPMTGAILEYLSSQCEKGSVVEESIELLDSALAKIIDEAYDMAQMEAESGGPAVVVATPSTTASGFNPNPYDIGSLTPFPVASRKVGSTIDAILTAETDNEITEAMLQFGRVSSIINERYDVTESGNEVFLMEKTSNESKDNIKPVKPEKSGSGIGKAARHAETKANQTFSKAATRDKTGGVKESVKRTIDPMEKFIQKQMQTLKEKDANERRNVILKGGVVPKVLRWVKRGIKILALGALGQIIPAAAIASGILFLGYVCHDKYLDRKERAKILRELEDEIQIVNEKIEDSRGDDNKQNKYELMRIRNQLTRTSERIRLGLKTDLPENTR